MKQLFLIAACFAVLGAHGQTVIQRGSTSTVVTQQGGLSIDNVFRPPLTLQSSAPVGALAYLADSGLCVKTVAGWIKASGADSIKFATRSFLASQGYLTSVPAQSWASITGRPSFATVATSGSYNDLTGKPAIPDTTSLSIRINDKVSRDSLIHPLGTIYNKSSWTNTADFVNNGATATVVGGKIRISGGVGDYLHTLDLPDATNLEHWKMRVKFTPISPGNGFAIGQRSINGSTPDAAYGVCATLFGGGTGGTGILRMEGIHGNNIVVDIVNNTNTGVPYSNTDQYELTIEQREQTFTTTVRDITTGSVTATGSYEYLPTVLEAPNTGRFALFSFGGTYQVDEMEITSGELVNSPLMLGGDSKLQMYVATSPESRAFTKVNAYFGGNVTLSAGGGDRTNEFIAKLPQIIKLKPKAIVLGIGSNDWRHGSSTATVEANYSTIVTTLQAAGIEVYHLKQIPETSGLNTYFTVFNAWLDANFPADHVLNTGTLTLAPDGIHPDDPAQTPLANTIINGVKTQVKRVIPANTSWITYNSDQFAANTGAVSVNSGFMLKSDPTSGQIGMGFNRSTTTGAILRPGFGAVNMQYTGTTNGGILGIENYNSAGTILGSIQLSGNTIGFGTGYSSTPADAFLTRYSNNTLCVGNASNSYVGGSIVANNFYSQTSASVANYYSSSPLTGYPRGIVQIGTGNATPLNNAALYVLPSNGAGVQTTNFLAIATNSNVNDATELSVNLIQTPTLAIVSTSRQDGATAGGTPLSFNPGNTEAMRILANGSVGIGTTAPTAKLQVTGLAEYADNATAIAAGLTSGAFYRTGDVLKVVH